MVCPICKFKINVLDEGFCECGYFFKVKSRESYSLEGKGTK